MTTDFLRPVSAFASRTSVTLETRHAALAVAALFAAIFLGTAQVTGTALFSPDSWAYFELAKTIFGEHFYQFNTQRSYFPGEYSASFPFGYPVALALVQRVVGGAPVAAVALNAAAVFGTALLIFNIGATLRLPGLARLALTAALVLYPGYIEEVLAGRSIPLAILALLAAFQLRLRQQFFLAGLLLGLSVLIRFDFLAYAILFQIAAQLFGGFRPVAAVSMAAAFLLGAAPWMVYSHEHFGKLWISDNAWVASSALPVFFADYPPVALVTASDQPGLWLRRVIGNVVPLSIALAQSLILFPAAVVCAALAVPGFFSLRGGARIRMLVALLLIAASLGPYLLTGYFSLRYFVLPFLCISAIGLYIASNAKGITPLGMNASALALLAALLSIAIGARFLAKNIAQANALHDEMQAQSAQIAMLEACHAKMPATLFIFRNNTGLLASKYGALTGRRAAILPSNYNQMNEQTKGAYLKAMQPYFLIDNPAEIHTCPAQ